jgi:hypothetical protein
MAILDDLRYAVPLTAEEVVPETDMVPVFHPTGGHATTRSVSLASLAAALGGGGSGAGGVSQAAFDELKSSVIVDLNNLRDTIMLMQASLDMDAGVATDTWVETGTPPALTTE